MKAMLRRLRPVSRSDRGFTLVEIVVAIAILSIAVVGLAGFALISSRALYRSKELSVGTIVAHEALDSLRSQPYAALPAGTATRTLTSGAFSFFVTTTITQDPRPLVRLKQVLVSVVGRTGREVQRLQSSVYGDL
jgi:prepilin-type N-terminal cleavage/methylation domain-containing protein